MSDDGYAADSPFDGGDDYYFWDDTASQDVADDLAERTMPSPVYLEDPAYEMMGGYSDWEYYSDDYYDDDPNLLKNNPQAGSPPASLKLWYGQANSDKVQKRGRKRKLVDTEEIPPLSLGGPRLVEIVQNIGQNILGTTWKVDRPKSEEPYQQGETKRVALLKDWRNVFRESQPKSDRRSKGMSSNKAATQDEWANDLSLADMGLMTATGKHFPPSDLGNDYDEDEDESEDEELGLDERGNFQDGASGIEEVGPLDEEADIEAGFPGVDDQQSFAVEPIRVKAQSLDQILLSRKRKGPDEGEAGQSSLAPPNESDVELRLAERIFSTSKKRKTGPELSALSRSTRHSNITTSLGTSESQANGTPKRGSGRPKKQSIQHTEASTTSTVNAKNLPAQTTSASAPKGRKRKATTDASADNEDGPTEKDGMGATGGTTSSRAKRVASSTTALRNDKDSQPMLSSTKNATRGFRARKS
jgi:hypothetical protein